LSTEAFKRWAIAEAGRHTPAPVLKFAPHIPFLVTVPCFLCEADSSLFFFEPGQPFSIICCSGLLRPFQRMQA